MKKIKLIVLLSITIFLTNCNKDFFDVNENPNNPTSSTPSLTLPVAEQQLLFLNSRGMNYLGNFMVDNWAVPSNWSAMQDLIRYNVTSTFYAFIFEDSYADIIKNLTYIETYEDGIVDYSAYKVIASALKGYQYQYLVDLYGDIPYTEAGQRAENTTPAYDKAEDVYKSVIESLTNAATLAVNMPEIYENPDSQDFIFHGDMMEWAKFINTVKLRMLVRLSNTGQDSYIKGEIAKIDDNGAGYVDSDVLANPGYSDSNDKQNPFFAYLGNNAGTNSGTDRNDFTVASDYILNVLTLNNDLRYMRLFDESDAGGYKGVYQATALPGEGYTSKDLSHLGPGLLISSEQDQPLMLLSESLFLQAEAIVRGYISDGESVAKDLYEAGIEASFSFLKVPDASNEAMKYFNQDIANVGWDSSPNKIEAIITQKSIALNGVNGIESWIELTRTGFPSGIPIPDETDGVRPVRLIYPASEYARNTQNVPQLTNADAFTKYPFWK